MNMKMPAELLRATRLVRGGRLSEATALIQRALSGVRPYKATSQSRTAAIELPAPLDLDTTAHEEAADASSFSARTPRSQPRTGGRFTTATYTSHAGTLEYKTYVPAQCDPTPPLIVMLHGCKQDPDTFAAATRMNALADEHGFVVLYPRQASKANVSHCWNWFQAQHQERDRGEPALIAGVTRAVIAEHQLDPARVYVAGLSAGGAMAAVMGATYPDLYCAVGIHSGLAYAAARDMPSAFAAMRGDASKRSKRPRVRANSGRDVPTVPTIVFHGDSDTTVHPSNGEHVIAQASSRSSDEHVKSRRPPEITLENGTAGGRTYTKRTYHDAKRKPLIEHWVVHGAGHAWSGGSTEGSFADPEGPDASREMLRFFLQHAKE